MKKCIVLCILLVLLTNVFVFSNAEISVFVDDVKVEFDADPIQVNDRTLVPMRTIFEKLGARVRWDNDTDTAYAYIKQNYVALTIDSDIMNSSFGRIVLDVPARLIGDKTFVPLRAVSETFGYIVEWDEDNCAVNIYTNKEPEHSTVSVSTPDELLNSIKSNRTIILTSDYYDLSRAKIINNPWVETGLNSSARTIRNVSNLTITGDAEIVIEDIMEDVLRFENCNNITISGIAAGHKEGLNKYYCEGAVISFEDCENVIIENSTLYGCGAFGVFARNTNNININKCDIYDCTYTGVWISLCKEVKIFETEFHDSVHMSGFARIDSSDVEFENCNVYNIDCTEFGDFIDSMIVYSVTGSNIVLNNCKFTNNVFVNIATEHYCKVKFANCIFEGNEGEMSFENVTYDNCTIK